MTYHYSGLEQYIFEKLVGTYENYSFPVISPRIMGDAIQQWVSDILKEYCQHANVDSFVPSEKLSRRDMADCIIDAQGNHHVIDIKTHCKSGTFSAPNLVSIKRLYDFLTSDSHNHFDIIIVDYSITGDHVQIDNVHFMPITSIDWSCLRIGNLGHGQLQLKDANAVVRKHMPRLDWLETLRANIIAFYIKQQTKIQKEINYYGLD